MAKIMLKSGRRVEIKETFAQVMQKKTRSDNELLLHDNGDNLFRIKRQDILDVRD